MAFIIIISSSQALIDTHDLNTKIRKVKECIDDGLQVKLTIFAKKPAMRKNPLAMDETTIKVLDCIEPFIGTVQPITRMPTRVDFILHPKKGGSGVNSPLSAEASTSGTDHVVEKK